MTERSATPLDRARAAYRGISLYQPDRTPCRIDLSDNTNLFGVPPTALSILRAAPENVITRYPLLYADRLKAAIGFYAGVNEDNVVTGCGSDDVLDSTIRAFCDPGSLVATSTPSFAMIPLLAQMNGLDVVEVPLRNDLDIDAEALVAAHAAVTYVCTPNNPTGNAISRESIDYVIDNAAGIVIIDEAYSEFGWDSWLLDAAGLSHVLAVRTLSKAFGLAGLRVGYAVGARELVTEVEKSRGPYKVSSIAEDAATAALTSDLEWVGERVGEVIENRARFIDELRGMGLKPLDSDANFILLPTKDAAETARQMRMKGVAVRPFPALPVTGDALRISIGPWHMMEDALAALGESVR
jgi:histidinol-phosphate aminotransferase